MAIRVPLPARAVDGELPAERLDAVDQPEQAGSGADLCSPDAVVLDRCAKFVR
jgi:hypothetical protein